MTLTEIQTMIDLYIEAEKGLTKHSSVSIKGRSYTRENLAEIRKGRQEWERRKADYLSASDSASATYSVADFT